MNEHSKRPAAFPGEPEDKGQQFRVQTILIALRCWWKIAAPLGILLAVGAAAAVYFTSKPQYTAFVLLKIPDRPAYLLENHWVTDPRKTVENELELMRSPAVIDPVASIPAVANTPEIARERHPTLALRKLLRVSARGRSDYFSIEFTSEDPQRAALVVNAVADAYLNLQRSSYYERQEKTIRLLEEQQTRQHTLVEELRGKFTTLYKQQTGVDPFPIGPNAGVMQLNDPTALLQSRLLEAKIDQLFLKAQFDADQELLNKEPSDPPQTKVKEHVDADPEVNLLETKIASNKAKMREYEAVSKNLEQHPGYQDLKAGVTEYESQLEKLRSELTDEIKGQMIAAAKLHRDDGLKALQDRLATTNFAVEILEEKIASDKAGRKTQNSETVMLADARYDYETARSFHQAIKQKVDSLRIEQGADNPVELFRKAVTPPAPDGDAPYKKMAMVAMAAFCLPFGLAVLAEHLYRRVSSRDQLEISNGIHVVGEVTSLPRRSRSTKKGKKPVNRDLQLFEESIDGLRTYLTLVHSVQGLQVLAVTSAVSREGKTSLAAQLAISIASATGESTLLIDGDMRSPDVHRAFDIQRGPGLVDVLCGDVSAEDVINADYSESLHLMPAGALSSSPHKLLGSDEFRNMLDGLRGKYRHILIDTPPLLPASEALLLARAADAALVCVRRDYSRMSQTVEAFSRLRSAGVKVAGAVLNGIPARMYVYRYGAYYSERPRLTGAPAEDLAGCEHLDPTHRNRSVKRYVLSIRVLIISLIAVMACAAGAYGMHQWQMSRIASALLDHAQKAEDSEEWDKAAGFLDRYLRIHPDNATVRGRLALTFAKGAVSAETKDQAVDLCYRALAAGQSADELELRTKLAELLVATGRFLEAESEAQKVVKMDSADAKARASAHRSLAIALFGQLQQGSLPANRLESLDLDEKIQNAREANPQAVDLAEISAALYRLYPHVIRVKFPKMPDAERVVRADAFLDVLLQQSPRDSAAYLARFRYRNTYSLPGADEDLDQALKHAPNEPAVVMTAALAALQSAQASDKVAATERADEKYKDARELFQKLIAEKAFPQSPEPHLGLGDASLKTPGLDEALKVWREGLQHFQQPTAKASFHARIADALIAADRDREADESLTAIDEVLAMVGGAISSEEQLGLQQSQDLRRSALLMKREQYLAAIPLLQRVLARETKGTSGPDVAFYAWNQLGRASAGLEEWTDAATAFDRASTHQPQANEPRISAAFAWLNAGRPELAAERSEQVIAVQPTFDVLMILAAAQFQIQISTSPAERSWTRLEEVLQAAEQAPADQPRKWRSDLLRAEYLTYRTRADGNEESGQKQARAILDAAVTEHAQSPELLLRACLAYENLNLPAEADRVLEHMRSANLPVVEIAVAESRLLVHRKQFAEARAALEKANESISTTERTRLKQELVNVADLSGDQKLLASLLEGEIKGRPTDIRTICRRCELAIEQNDLTALQTWSGSLATQGAVGLVWSHYYEVFRLYLEAKGNREKLQAASVACDRLAAIKPNWGRGLVLRGMIEQSLGNLKQASDAYEHAIDTGIADTGVYERLIALLERQHQYANAEKYLSRLESWLPFSQRLTEFAGSRELRQDRPQQAIEIARRAVARRPADAQARIWLARLLLLNKQHPKSEQESEQEFLKAVELAPSDIRSWNGLFSYYLRTSAPKKARETLAKLAEKVSLEAVERDFVLAQGLEMLGDWEAAEAAYQKAAGQSEKNAMIQVRLAGVYLRTDPQRAIECLRRAVEWDPSSAPPRRMLAALLASRGTDESVQEAESLLSAEPNSDLSVTIEDRRLRALLLAQNGNVARIGRAIQLLEEIIAGGKGSLPGDRLVLAQLYELESKRLTDKVQAASRLKAALEQYVTVAARPNPSASHLIAIVEFLIRTESAGEATVWIEKLEALVPPSPKSNPELIARNPELIARIVELRIKCNAVAECQAWLARLEEEDDKKLRPFILRAKTLSVEGKQAEAASLLNTKAEEQFAMAMDEKAKVEIAKAAGDFFFDAKQYENAAAWYERLAQIDPQQSPLVILAMARQDRVLEAIQKCVDHSKQDETSRYAIVAAAVLAESNAAADAHQLSEPLIASALKQFPEDLNLLYSVGTLRVAQNRYPEATTLFRKIIAVNPRHVAALNNLALILAESPTNRPEALKMIEQAIGVVGENPGLLDTKGAILVYDGKSEVALPILEVATRGTQVDPRHNLHLAAAYEQTDKSEEAREQLRTALDQQLETLILTRSDKDLLRDLKTKLKLETTLTP